MTPTRDARTARRRLSEVGVSSGTVLLGSQTITIDIAAFDQLADWRHRGVLATQNMDPDEPRPGLGEL